MVALYTLDNIIGKGAHATIYNGIDNKKPIAVKVFNLSSDISKQAYLREVHINKLIGSKSKRFCKKIKNYTDLEYGYICMKKYDCDLYEYAFERNNNLSLYDIVQIFKKICKSISILHKRHIAHLDIKPDNILVDSKSKYFVVTDFGCSFIDNNNETIQYPCGSPYYFPSHDDNIDPFKVDIYSLGVTLHVLLTKSFPTINNKTKKWQNTNKNLTISTIILLQAMLSPNINERPSISEILKFSFCKQKNQQRIRIETKHSM